MALLGVMGTQAPITNSDLPMLPAELRPGGRGAVEIKVGIREVTRYAMGELVQQIRACGMPSCAPHNVGIKTCRECM